MKVTLVESDPEWIAIYAEERDHLLRLLEPMVSQIDHIGSTAVPGLPAKPIVDIQVGVKSITDFDNESGVHTLQNGGYEYLPHFEQWVPYRRLFIRDNDGVRKSNVHVVSADHPWIQRHTIFRDYLIANATARDQYAATKQQLAEREWESVNDYAGAKTEVVFALEDEAFQHFNLPPETRAWLRSSRID